ncbi:MAG: hypothetical protein SFW63_06340 [Alphaproteobacteria bacterium]|nr:hypothetical protein [Alphaproteobacteria bacterium]
MSMVVNYTIFIYISVAFVLHVLLHWAYEESEGMSSADYLFMTFFIYLGVFIFYVYHLPMCHDQQIQGLGLCWMNMNEAKAP